MASHKKVTSKRATFTKPEREYVKGMVHNLSFQRLTDQEIVQWLHDEKEIDIDRSTVSKIRNQVESKAEKWYIELKKSTYKFVAIYKERIDSLFSYQKKLHEIIDATNKPEVKLRAISELHSIEMSIFNLWKQLPDLQIEETHKQLKEKTEEENKSPYVNIYNIMPEDRSKITPVSICRCRTEIEHFACNKCMSGFCRPVESTVDGIVKCPDCNSVVYEPADPGWV